METRQIRLAWNLLTTWDKCPFYFLSFSIINHIFESNKFEFAFKLLQDSRKRGNYCLKTLFKSLKGQLWTEIIITRTSFVTKEGGNLVFILGSHMPDK